MKYDFQICSLIWPEHCFYHWFCRKCAEQKLHPLSYADGDMDSQCQQDQHKSQYVPHIICDSGLGAKMSVLFACLIKRVSKLPLYGKCSKISNTLKLRTPKIIAENNF